MVYKNKNTGRFYAGGIMTYRIDESTVFSGIPTSEQLKEWGFEAVIPTEKSLSGEEVRAQRMEEIINELQATDFIVLMDYEGEDTSKYKGWRENRKALREEYRKLEAQKENEK